MEQLNVQLSRLTRSLRRARTVELPEGKAQRDIQFLGVHAGISQAETHTARLTILCYFRSGSFLRHRSLRSKPGHV